MKFAKLSLVAVLAVGSFSVADAVALEEAIKEIDFSGALRYRYDTVRLEVDNIKQNTGNKSQDHNYRAQLNFKAAIADNFKTFIQLNYNNNDIGYGVGSISDTSNTFTVRQAYLEYSDIDYSTSVLLGKYQLNTIWTDNDLDGLVGTGAKLIYTGIDGLTLSAFVVDSFNHDEQADEMFHIPVTSIDPTNGAIDISRVLAPYYFKNLYGLAALRSYELGSGVLDSQLWLGFIQDSALLYAFDFNYAMPINEQINWSIRAEYLANVIHDDLINTYGLNDGDFLAIEGTLEGYGWDGSLGALYYGRKNEATITVLEDMGNIISAGEEILNTEGSSLHGSFGRNLFAFATLGYTFDEVLRLGIDLVYGGTRIGDDPSNVLLAVGAGKKFEGVARVKYDYSPQLSFSSFYSYIKEEQKFSNSEQNFVRLQALYKF